MKKCPGIPVGRFAPSPTGPLHFGSLLTAVASYAEAKSKGGCWLVRIEDIDPPREMPAADKLILGTLETYGFEWDDTPAYQSSFSSHHYQVAQKLIKDKNAYHCTCSRKDLSKTQTGILGTIYPGTCRNGCANGDFAIRIRTNDELIGFKDLLQGTYEQRLESKSGDFIIVRKDDLIAYNLAVVIDDFQQGITEVVRGIDLLTSTPRHIWLQQVLGFPTPSYMHIPVAVNNDGQKLSKLTGATGIDSSKPNLILFKTLQALRQNPPPELALEKPITIWQWVMENWSVAPLKKETVVCASKHGF
ncbi:MAG: tRNA glutamyl-Q(34) synthetase GluQRS [Woeseia sp.]|nr:tRNA glutamyl-Q(34) synthetase GluQRS [Woeseia sp.]|tara:strand:+ start:536 stop:1444 length:909 start_codon:yes stop_codon:yes gene_type:complete